MISAATAPSASAGGSRRGDAHAARAHRHDLAVRRHAPERDQDAEEQRRRDRVRDVRRQHERDQLPSAPRPTPAAIRSSSEAQHVLHDEQQRDREQTRAACAAGRRAGCSARAGEGRPSGLMLGGNDFRANDARSARLPAPPPAERVLVIRLGALGDVVRTRFAFAGHPRAVPAREDRLARRGSRRRGTDRTRRARRSRGRAAPQPARATPARRAAHAARVRARAARARVRSLDRLPRHVSRRAPAPGRPASRCASATTVRSRRRAAQRLLTHRLRVGPAHFSRFERNAALVQYLGGEVPDAPAPLALDDAADRAARRCPSAFALIHPGTSPKTSYKRWETERFAAVARALHERTGLTSLVAFGPVPGEQAAAHAVVATAGGAAALAPPTASLAEFLRPARPRDRVRRLRLGPDAPRVARAHAGGRDLRPDRPDRERAVPRRAEPDRARATSAATRAARAARSAPACARSSPRPWPPRRSRCWPRCPRPRGGVSRRRATVREPPSRTKWPDRKRKYRSSCPTTWATW